MEDYKIRFINEYNELVARRLALHKMLIKYQAGTLDFKFTCPTEVLTKQYQLMTDYMDILEIRAELEGIDLEDCDYASNDNN